jgi:hypothetical protein
MKNSEDMTPLKAYEKLKLLDKSPEAKDQAVEIIGAFLKYLGYPMISQEFQKVFEPTTEPERLENKAVTFFKSRL